VKAPIPERIPNPTPADILALVSRAIFQAGLSWQLIASKWDAYLRLFNGFEPSVVAAYGEADVERIMADGGVVRTRKKIVATIDNARALLEILGAHGSFAAYARSFGNYDALERDMRARFKFLGALSVYYVLFRAGEAVPRFEDWAQTIPGDHPRMREMIARARESGWEG